MYKVKEATAPDGGTVYYVADPDGVQVGFRFRDKQIVQRRVKRLNNPPPIAHVIAVEWDWTCNNEECDAEGEYQTLDYLPNYGDEIDCVSCGRTYEVQHNYEKE
jgi:hypothetical protein